MIENLIRYESATGKTLAMWEFLPEIEDGRRPSAGMVLIHGLGDYVMRYRDTAETLTAMGIAVVGIDLPGHGESEGKRGDVGRLSDVYTVINEARATLRELVEPIGGMVGALAHSTGGMLLFDYLTRFPGNFAFAWVNACLVEPLHRRSSRAAALAKVAKYIVPTMTISTKVVPSMGREGAPDEQPPQEERRGHDRVSVRFGAELMRAQKQIASLHTNLDRDFRLLMTHGGRDEVCPIEFAREFYSKLEIRKKEFREFPEHLHHLLHDPAVMAFGQDWLRRVLAPARPVQRS
jgi:alpha-beta hydrolase superfamily lysophospholipase